MKPVHILIVLLAIASAGIAVFAVAALIQIILMPDISPLALGIYYGFFISIPIAIAIRIISRRH